MKRTTSPKQSRLSVVPRLRTIAFSVPAVNKGGCAFVALALHKHVTRNYPHKSPQIYYLLDAEDAYKHSTGGVVSCYHAVVRIGAKYYDSTGAATLAEILSGYGNISLTPVIVSPEYVAASLKRDAWNPSFNRDNVKHINKLLS